MNYAFAMTAPVSELAAVLGINRVTAASEEDQKQKAAKLAQNHGFLKGLMTRVGKHFQAAGAGAWRILKSGGVWFGLLSLCVSAVVFLFEARQLRHFKQQPLLGKARVFGVGLSFGAFIGTFLNFFKKIAMAWKNEAADTEEKKKAEALLSRLSQAERVAMMARVQAKPAHASAAFAVLASALEAQGAVTIAHVAEAVSLDDIVDKAKAMVFRAKKAGRKFVDASAKKALAFARKYPKDIFWGLVVAAFYVYVFGPIILGMYRHKKTQPRTVDGVGGVWATKPTTLKQAKEVFDNLAKRKADISDAVYSEIRKASDLVGKGLVLA